jgi:transposase
MAERGHAAELETVQGWIKEAKKRGLIAPDELRKPKRSKGTEQK